MRALIAMAAVALVLPGAADTKYGDGVTLEQTTKIEAILASPGTYAGKTVRIDGVATAVCAHMGCWMAVAPFDNPSGPTIRLKVDDGVIVFPVTAKGKRVSAQGVYELVGGPGTTDDAKDAAGEHARVDPKASKDYQLKATGAIVRGD
jgi:hypothetical protein